MTATTSPTTSIHALVQDVTLSFVAAHVLNRFRVVSKVVSTLLGAAGVYRYLITLVVMFITVVSKSQNPSRKPQNQHMLGLLGLGLRVRAIGFKVLGYRGLRFRAIGFRG